MSSYCPDQKQLQTIERQRANTHALASVATELVITILYEEPHFMLVNKPAGLLTQAVEGIESLQTRLAEQIKIRDQHPGLPFIGLPHRLDRGTSGVVLIARNQRALRRFGDQFHHRLVQKFYLAWVEGEMGSVECQWSDYVRKVEDQPLAEIVSADAPGAKLAEMQVQQIASCDGQSLALIRLLTGRMHQIRVQFASRGLPVVGDQQYGSQVRLSDHEELRLRPHGLHALRLEFRHPQTAIFISATAAIPEYWQKNPGIFAACQKLAHQSVQQKSPAWQWPLLRLAKFD
jgi:23S rRNA pseudouridine1911/1915/1917 synthase